MKCASAIILLVATITSAEPPAPRGGYYARQHGQQNNNFAQQSAPYPPRGFRPNGPSFNLPQRQQNVPQAPTASYGPPPPVYQAAAEPTTEVPTTTEFITEETTTTLPQAENLELQPKTDKLQANPSSPNIGALYVVVPQSQNFVYSAPVTASIATSNAKLVSAQPEAPSARLIPIQAVPAFAKLVNEPTRAVPTYTRVVEQPSQLVYQQYQVASAAPVLAKIQEEPWLRYQTVAYASPDYSAAYVQRF